jgi:hypothetical protein
MTQEFKILRDEINLSERELEIKKMRLARMVNSCQHKWGSTQAAHVYQAAYTIPGDPPGTMGVDWRGPTYVSAKTDKRWKRVCEVCGKEEFTTATDKTVTETPKF